MTQRISTPPQNDEIEVSIFGSGYGESILIHTGQNEWTVIDSCEYHAKKTPAASYYLKEIGCDISNCIKLIIASHWDDDHISLLSDIVKDSDNAIFATSAALFDKKMLRTIAEDHNQNINQNHPSGLREFLEIYKHIMEKKKKFSYGQMDTLLWKSRGSNNVEVFALSPHSSVFDSSINAIISSRPDKNSPKGYFRPPKPNQTSIALLVKISGLNILLGGDLEENSTHKGWTLILENSQLFDNKACVFKVPHHGSENGHKNEVWSNLLERNPISLIAPWELAGNFLPKGSDLQRIKNFTNNIFVTSSAKTLHKKKKPDPHLKRIYKLRNIKSFSPKLSFIRLRLPKENSIWSVEMFGNAYNYF